MENQKIETAIIVTDATRKPYSEPTLEKRDQLVEVVEAFVGVSGALPI